MITLKFSIFGGLLRIILKIDFSKGLTYGKIGLTVREKVASSSLVFFGPTRQRGILDSAYTVAELEGANFLNYAYQPHINRVGVDVLPERAGLWVDCAKIENKSTQNNWVDFFY